MSRNASSFADGSVMAAMPTDYNSAADRWQHQQQQAQQHKQHQHQGNDHMNNQQSDIINMQYMELEEFLLENSVTVVQQVDAGKVFVESLPSSGLQLGSAEKQYQVSLEQRGSSGGGAPPATTSSPAPFPPGMPSNHQLLNVVQQHSSNALGADPNSPPQSNCSGDSPPQDMSMPGMTQVIPSVNDISHPAARKSYPRRVSTSSASSSLAVTPPHTPQQPSPPLLIPSMGPITPPKQEEEIVKKRRPVKRSRKANVPQENKDDKYWRRRAKNNEAAKRSRDLRREKENHIMTRVAFLEKENRLLRQEMDSIKMENDELRERLARYEI